MAWFPIINYLGRQYKEPTAFDAMGFVSHYQESKHFSKVQPDFSYSLRFPGDRNKFEHFIKKMNLQDHKISDDEYKIESDGGGRRATFSSERKGLEIEFTAYQT